MQSLSGVYSAANILQLGAAPDELARSCDCKLAALKAAVAPQAEDDAARQNEDKNPAVAAAGFLALLARNCLAIFFCAYTLTINLV